jgi:uncharacterized protein YegP (UPF0339 family)
MGKLLRLCALFAALAALTAAAGVTVAPAQVKDKKADTKDASGVIEVYMAKDGWRYRVKNAEGKSIAISSVGYPSKEECLKVIDTVKSTLIAGKMVVLDEKKDAKKK